MLYNYGSKIKLTFLGVVIIDSKKIPLIRKYLKTKISCSRVFKVPLSFTDYDSGPENESSTLKYGDKAILNFFDIVYQVLLPY